jgi:hypothetical protein
MATVTLRPNAAGDLTEFSCSGINYQAISDQSDNTYIYKGGSSNLTDLYNIPSIPSASAISKITVYARARETDLSDGIWIEIKSGGSIQSSSRIDLSDSWATKSKEWATNPTTGNAWTEDEINGLQIGVTGAAVLYNAPGHIQVSEVYVIVDYTPVNKPTVTTQAVSDITHNSGKGNGEITATGGENATERGFEYKQGATGTIIKTYDTGSFGTGTFNKVITGLSPNTLYYVRAYAKNSAGIGYGDWVTFTTDKTTPTVVTNEATEVDKDKFKANGNITATGGENCTVRGFQYGLTPIATWDTHDEGSYEAGAFNKVISGLQANTIYYFRAYATNSVGTTYGSWLQVVTASAGTTPSGTKISLVGDYSGYVDKLHASEQDLGANYKGYFVLTTDFAEGQSLAVYKRLLYLVNYFRKETSGEVKISVKCDNETDWREIGTVDLTGDEDILMQEMGVDELGKHFLIKFEGENAFRYLGTIFWYLVQGVR